MTEQSHNENFSSKLIKRIAAPQVAPPWQMSDVIVSVLALALAMMLIAPTIASGLSPSLNALTPQALMIGWSIGAIIASAFILISRRSDMAHMVALRLQGSGLMFFYLLLMGVAVALIADLIAAAISGGFIPVAELTGISGTTWVIAGFFMMVLQPLSEGLLFQGIVLPFLRTSFGARPGYLATVLLFVVMRVLIYGTALSGNAFIGYGIIIPLLTGLSVSAMRLYTGSTRDAIIMQAGIGLTFILTAIFLTG
ncbi:MAG: type II CAAX prenyl endopeptidase Rce1 family protein [Aggregatilineales bacterium]